jgi:hypothetical protein
MVCDLPPPILFNPWKHHAGWLRERIAQTAAAGVAALPKLASQLVVIGTELMDLYYGLLSPVEIAERIRSQLEADNRLPDEAFRFWMIEGGGYRVLTLAEDQSRWVVRQGDEAGRYVHIHPGRGSSQTRRVRANVLKTAVLVRAAAAVEGGDPLEQRLVNRVRQQYLGLSPIGRLANDEGLGEVIALLKPR